RSLTTCWRVWSNRNRGWQRTRTGAPGPERRSPRWSIRACGARRKRGSRSSPIQRIVGFSRRGRCPSLRTRAATVGSARREPERVAEISRGEIGTMTGVFRITSRHVWQAIAVVGLLLTDLGLAPAPCSAEFPERPIHLIVPFPPGGAVDLVTRLVTQR